MRGRRTARDERRGKRRRGYVQAEIEPLERVRELTCMGKGHSDLWRGCSGTGVGRQKSIGAYPNE